MAHHDDRLVAALARLEHVFDVLRTGYVRDGWHLDEQGCERTLAYFRAAAAADKWPQESDDEMGFAIHFLSRLNQSLDWVFRAGVMICELAAAARITIPSAQGTQESLSGDRRRQGLNRRRGPARCIVFIVRFSNLRPLRGPFLSVTFATALRYSRLSHAEGDAHAQDHCGIGGGQLPGNVYRRGIRQTEGVQSELRFL